jgi:hypothetical protein
MEDVHTSEVVAKFAAVIVGHEILYADKSRKD